MKTKTAIIISLFLSLAIFSLAASCHAQGVAQYVGGDFGRMWLASTGYQYPQPAQSDQSELWYWGGGPKGSMVVDGKLVPDPRYIWKSENGTGYWAGWKYPYASGWNPVYSPKYPYTFSSGPYYVSPYYYPSDYLGTGYVARRIY